MGGIIMEMISWLNIILWSFYILLYVYREINNKNVKVSKINILFLVLFLVYNYILRKEIIPILYLILIIFSIIYLLYDYFNIIDGFEINKRNVKYIGGTLLVIGLVFIYVLLKNDFLNAYLVTLIINAIFIPIYILVKNNIKNN